MFAQRSQMKPAIRRILTLSGLLLMIASFIWMQRIPKPGPTTRAKTARPPTTPEPFAVVVLDPGNGRQDSGAMCNGVLEKDHILDVARRMDRMLEDEGIATLMTRMRDTYLSVAGRAPC